MSDKIKVWRLIALTCLPFIFGIDYSGEKYTTIISLSGFLGTVFLRRQYLLGNRFLIGFANYRLIKYLELHKWLGIRGMLLILAHPIAAVLAGYGARSYIFTLDFSSSYETYLSLGKIALYLMLLIFVSSKPARKYMSFGVWKAIHYLTYLMLPLVLIHGLSSGTFLPNNMMLKIARGFLSITYAIIVISKIAFQLGRRRNKYIIKSNEKLTPSINKISFMPKTNKYIIPKNSGQFIYLQISTWQDAHPFTYRDFDPQNGEISVVYEIVGNFTKQLSSQTAGKEITLDGTYGEFFDSLEKIGNFGNNNILENGDPIDKLQSSSISNPALAIEAISDETNITLNNISNPACDRDSVVFIAGGVGITPFYNAIKKYSNCKNIHLAHLVKKQEDIIDHEFFSSKLGSKYNIYISRENNESDTRSHVFYKRISDTDLIGMLYKPSIHNTKYYICSSASVAKGMQDTLIGLGIKAENIHTEAFGW